MQAIRRGIGQLFASFFLLSVFLYVWDTLVSRRTRYDLYFTTFQLDPQKTSRPTSENLAVETVRVLKSAGPSGETWELDESTDARFSVEGAAHTAGKGGVEIYPVQRSRRPRTTHEPLAPELEEMGGIITAWRMPSGYSTGGAEAIKGVYLVFHGCDHGPLDWFDLPEERTIVSHLVSRGYAVVAPASKDRKTGCWRVNVESGDVASVKAMLWRWYSDWAIPSSTPFFLFGASSGGDMSTYLGSQGGMWLYSPCGKERMYVKVSGVLSQVSWGVPARNYGKASPPIAFMPMPKGEMLYMGAGYDVDKAKTVFGNTGRPPPQIVAIAKAVRQAGGRPRLLYLPLGELPIYKLFFSDRVWEVSPEQSEEIFEALLRTRTMRCDPSWTDDEDVDCFLSRQLTGSTLEALVRKYQGSIKKGDRSRRRVQDDNLSTFVNKTGGATAVSVGPEEVMDREPLTLLQARAVFRELLNTAWAAHEMSADFVELWEAWLWDSCGEACSHNART